jgi:hypothetical protein
MVEMNIKEMAVNSAKRINEETIGSYTRGYENGANAVLDQLNGLINRLDYGLKANCIWTSRNAFDCLKKKIEELKGS